MPETVLCPICGSPVPFNDPNMPFCSDRCRLLDLGNWASEKYVVGSSPADEIDEADEDNLPPPGPKGRER